MLSFQPIACLREGEKVEIASLSKIMTGYLSILICRKYEVDLK
jgi:D-alanyl-D-alanine carboxypeptidase